MEKRIVHPNENLDETRMVNSQNTMLFNMLKKELPRYTEQVVKTGQAMHDRLRLMYIDGFSDSLDHWGEFAKNKKQFMASAQELVEELNKWETKFIEWQKKLHGEDAIKQKLAQALKG